MHPETNEARLDHPATLRVADAPATDATAQTVDGEGNDTETIFRIMTGCLDSMELIRCRIEDLETRVTGAIDAGTSGRAAMRAEMATVQAAIVSFGDRIVDGEARLGRVETGLRSFVDDYAEALESARTEAKNWRLRAETDRLGFEHLNGRLLSLETGLSAQLDETTQRLATSEANNDRLQAVNHLVEGSCERLRLRVVDLDATIADQRSRIVCLQTKLAHAAYAQRCESMSRAMGAPAETILDLKSDTLISAA